MSATLYVTEQGAVISKRGDRLLVVKKGIVLADVPCGQIGAVLLFGNIQCTTQAIAEMLEHGIELALLTSRGRLRGQLTPPWGKNVELRLLQYERTRDPVWVLTHATRVVRAKIGNQLLFLRRLRDDRPGATLGDAVERLEECVEGAGHVGSLDALMGLEGLAAKTYFRTLGALMPEQFRFAGRSRRPPRDPANSLLSLGYTLVANELTSLLDGAGLDPYVGFLHRAHFGRPSLAADLLEEFRAPLVDRLVVSSMTLRVVTPASFVTHAPSGAIHLTAEALRAFLREYERHMSEVRAAASGSPVSYRNRLRGQVEALTRAIRADEPYQPFVTIR